MLVYKTILGQLFQRSQCLVMSGISKVFFMALAIVNTSGIYSVLSPQQLSGLLSFTPPPPPGAHAIFCILPGLISLPIICFAIWKLEGIGAQRDPVFIINQGVSWVVVLFRVLFIVSK